MWKDLTFYLGRKWNFTWIHSNPNTCKICLSNVFQMCKHFLFPCSTVCNPPFKKLFNFVSMKVFYFQVHLSSPLVASFSVVACTWVVLLLVVWPNAMLIIVKPINARTIFSWLWFIVSFQLLKYYNSFSSNNSWIWTFLSSIFRVITWIGLLRVRNLRFAPALLIKFGVGGLRIKFYNEIVVTVF